MTDGQLRSKRDEFWDTAPAFEGRKEIWDALKAAAYAAEANDHELAQAILDGASITLPHGEQAQLAFILARDGGHQHSLEMATSRMPGASVQIGRGEGISRCGFSLAQKAWSKHGPGGEI